MKLYLVGGFLGSGKTTAIQQASLHLLKKGVRLAVITNDQGEQLVDGMFIQSLGITSKEVKNGCFCCNYNQLTDHILTLCGTVNPEVIFAESVGSCTDLVATVVKPLRKFHTDVPVVLSVFADASLLYSLMNGQSSFLNEKVQYIYKKQLEEADILVINKVDLLDSQELAEVEKLIALDYLGKKVLYQNSLDSDSLQDWIIALGDFDATARKQSLEINYDIYAEGEAMLGWLDKQLLIETENEDAAAVALAIILGIYAQIKRKGYLIGHLKFLLDDGTKKVKISFTGTGNDLDKQATQLIPTNKLSLLINARVQAAPEVLEKLIQNSISEIILKTSCFITPSHSASFKPGYPKPTYRIAE
jgi:Ni2+-binding GTPase involved in maturation of urease and hydrogenase